MSIDKCLSYDVHVNLLTNNQIEAIKHGRIMEKKSHHVETSFELMVWFTFLINQLQFIELQMVSEQSNKCLHLTTGLIMFEIDGF